MSCRRFLLLGSLVSGLIGSATLAADLPAAAPAVADTGAAATAAAAAVPEYRLCAGDVLEFRFPFSTELNFTAPIRPDGKMFFAYIGDVALAGLSVSEAHRILLQKFQTTLRDPEIFVLLKDYMHPRVFVAGEVPRPGRLDYFRGMSIFNAIFSAGGYGENAGRKSAVLIRKVSADQVRVYSVPLHPRRAGFRDILLEPEDIVLVPKSTIANLDKFVQQWSRELLPLSSVGVVFRAFGTSAVNVSLSP